MPDIKNFIGCCGSRYFDTAAGKLKRKVFIFMHKINTIAFFFLIRIFIPTGTTSCQDNSGTIETLHNIAHAVINDARFQFVDRKTGKSLNSTDEAAPGDSLAPVSRYLEWRYWNGVLNLAMIHLGAALHDSSYPEFSIKNIAFSFDNYRYFEKNYHGEGKWNNPFGQRFIMEELDDCGAMGASVIEVYRMHPQDRYREYIDRAADHILHRQGRLGDGTLVRSFPRRWTLWADDLYMGVSFLARMGDLTNDRRYFDDAAQQVIRFHKYLFDSTNGLMHHCWYSDSNKPGAAFWGRANGWALLAQVDLLDRLRQNFTRRDTLLMLLRQHIDGIMRYQGREGLWHQLLDKENSFLETSCSAMFTYAIARAVNKGYIGRPYAKAARRGAPRIPGR